MTSEPISEPNGPVAAPRPPSRRTGAVIGVLSVLLAGSLAAETFPIWRDQAGFPPAAAGFDVENLRAELAAATTRLSELEARQTQPATGGDAALAARIAGLEQAAKTQAGQPVLPAALTGEVEHLGRDLAELRKTAADSASVLRLADRLGQVEAGLRELQARRSSAAQLLLAVGQLRDSVALGRPFDAELRAVKVLAGDDGEIAPTLAALKDRSATGIAPRTALGDRFEHLAPALVRAQVLPETDVWWRRAAERLLSLVTIRREDGAVAGSDAAAVVGRAEVALARADLAAATAELDGLSGGAAEAARPWLAEAKARLAADSALSELTAHTLALTGHTP